MSDPMFFGYGSLVNAATHSYTIRPATLHGWRRIWCHTPARRLAYLSVQPDPTSQIDGITAPVPGADWEALDIREEAYDRIPCAAHIQPAQGPDIAVYAVPEHSFGPKSAPKPILLSYLDVVLQGYLHVFGPDGAARFLATTFDWEVGIVDDRACPIYPRAQQLSADETAWIDNALRSLPAEMLDLKTAGMALKRF